jgi:carboxyl-terminal processing protease
MDRDNASQRPKDIRANADACGRLAALSAYKTMKFRTLSAAVLALLALAILPLRSSALEWKPLNPGPNDATTAILTARMLERAHYSQMPFNDEVSSKFLDHYLNALDPQHIFFLQSDVEEFNQWRTKLDEMTVNSGDTSPGYIIFNRFFERLRQQHSYVQNLLLTEKFEFNTDERYLLNRKDAARPADLKEAKQLWRDRVRFEYLSEKLSAKAATEVKTKPDANPKEVKKTEPADKPDKSAATAPKGKTHEDIVKLITKRYDRILKTMEAFDADQVLQVYLSALTTIYDPHSDYLGKSEMDNFSINMRLSLFGIGAQLTTEDGYCKIMELVPGGPASRSKKLKPNDKIIAVAQGSEEPVDVVDMPLNKIVEKIRGQKGTEVRLTVIPADSSDSSARKIVSLVREEIKLEESEAKAQIIDVPTENGKTNRLGMIDLPSFYADFDADNSKPESERKSTTRDVSKLLTKLKAEGINGLILDLRRNGGGSLEEAIKLTGLFIKQGPVVQVKDPSGEVTVDKDTDPGVAFDGPMIVLTSRFSASASEILAGALQDYGRALIVGDSSTHGKGTVQTMISLARYIRNAEFDPGAIKVTIRKFYRPSGASTQRKGVVPDVVLPSVNNHAEVGEVSLENALPWDTIEPADFRPVNRIAAYLEELRQKSVKRVESSKDYAYIREDIERFDKMRADKTISLNEETRLKEKEEIKKIEETRKQERKDRHTPAPIAYKITLKQAALPGLPPPYDAAKEREEKRRAAGLEPDLDKLEEGEAPVEAVDATLNETENILLDLIKLSKARNALANNEPEKAIAPAK